MPNPFPGIDPWLEAYWGDVHASLVLYACDHLQRVLPKDLRARVEERVFVHDDLDYLVPSEPPLDPDTALWADDLLKRTRPGNTSEQP